MPFLERLDEELHDRFPRDIGTPLARAAQLHLLDRCDLLIAHALEAHFAANRRPVCAEREEPSAGDKEAFRRSVTETFRNAERVHDFFLVFPILGRWIAVLTQQIGLSAEELGRRLVSDMTRLRSKFDLEEYPNLSAIRMGLSDPHNHGRTVAEIIFSGVEGTRRIIYKPRQMTAEIVLTSLIATNLRSAHLPALIPVALQGDGYGYVDDALSCRKDEPESSAEEVYRGVGGVLAIAVLLGSSDLHHENLVVTSCGPYVCDGETALEVVPVGANRLLDRPPSVFRTAMLDWPLPAAGVPDVQQIGGISGGNVYRTSSPAPVVSNRGTLDIRVEYLSGVTVTPDSSNRISAGEATLEPSNFANHIREGFEALYDILRQDTSLLLDVIRKDLESADIRHVARATQIYATLLAVARHPMYQVDAVEFDLLLLEKLRPLEWDTSRLVYDSELRQLRRLDVPRFSACATATSLEADGETVAALERSPAQGVVSNLASASIEHRRLQACSITTSLQPLSDAFVETATDYAALIGETLCQLRESSAHGTWTRFDPSAGVRRTVGVSGNLYHGTAGIAFYLAYLDSLRPNRRFRESALAALDHAASLFGSEHEQTSAFQGRGGFVYTLAHLSYLWGDAKLADLCGQQCALLADVIDQCVESDVLDGLAGLIPVIESAGRVALSMQQMKSLIRRLADMLVERARVRTTGVSWCSPPDVRSVDDLTGFSHGSGGIGWALARAARILHDERYLSVANAAFRYEDVHIDPEQQDWLDLRRASNDDPASPRRHFANAWCNGAPGIGLARLAVWEAMTEGDPDLLSAAKRAARSSEIRSSDLENDSLCHGRSGNSELLIRLGYLTGDDRYLSCGRRFLVAQWSAYEASGRWSCYQEDDLTPGLMTGIAGIGLQFLRAGTNAVPTPLLLEPPGGASAVR